MQSTFKYNKINGKMWLNCSLVLRTALKHSYISKQAIKWGTTLVYKSFRKLIQCINFI